MGAALEERHEPFTPAVKGTGWLCDAMGGNLAHCSHLQPVRIIHLYFFVKRGYAIFKVDKAPPKLQMNMKMM